MVRAHRLGSNHENIARTRGAGFDRDMAPIRTVAEAHDTRQWIHIWCRDCKHKGEVDLDALPPDLLLDEMYARLTCSQCGARRIGITISVRSKSWRRNAS